jgi:hypothetical protein
MTKSLLIRLVLPLILLFGITFTFSRMWSQEAIYVNLTTEILGIIVTVSYVAWILRWQEEQKWKSTDDRILNRLKVLLNSILSSIRVGLGISFDVFQKRIPISNSVNLNDVHKEMISVSENVISPMILQHIRNLDTKGWKSLATQIANAHNSILVFLNAFHLRLSPDQISILLDLEETLSKSLFFYTITPEYVGVPSDKLPNLKNFTSKEWQESGFKSTTVDLQNVITLVKKLSQTINDAG